MGNKHSRELHAEHPQGAHLSRDASRTEPLWFRKQPGAPSTRLNSSPNTEAEADPGAPPPAAVGLLDEPWRETTRGSKEDLLESIRAYRPPEGVGHLRVLLYGPVGAGKSSLINSIQTALRGQAAILTPGNNIDTGGPSFTVKFETHRFHKVNRKDYFPFVFTDIMGLEPGNSGILPDDIKLAMEGHIKEGYRFRRTPLLETDDFYRKNPTLEDRVHLLVCVLSANSPGIHPTIISKINQIRKAARDLKIPEMAVVTNVDIVSREMEKDLKNVYKSEHLQGKMNDLSTSVGIPLNYMFPVKNYSRGNTECDEDMDTLLLTALDHMTSYGNDSIRKLRELELL